VAADVGDVTPFVVPFIYSDVLCAVLVAVTNGTDDVVNGDGVDDDEIDDVFIER
jgi:hypothetical protein